VTFLILSLLALETAVPVQAPQVSTPVLSRSIEKGQIFTADDFALEKRTAAQSRGALSPEALLGLEASRPLAAGAVLRSGDAVTPRLVKRGEPVTIRVRSGGLTISTSGRALADGRLGDVVRVVASTNRNLDGVVEATGAVRVAAP